MGSQGSLLYLYPTTLDFDSLKPSKLSLFVRKERDSSIITGTQILLGYAYQSRRQSTVIALHV